MNDIDRYIEKYLVHRYKNVSRKLNISNIQKIPQIYKQKEIKVNKNEVDFFNKSSNLLDVISKVAYWSAGVNEYEILNRYKVHTFNPTARNLHSPLVYFFIDGCCFRYNYLKNKFDVFKIDEISTFDFKDKFYIMGCSELFGLTTFYGEFAYFLSGLDEGHLLHNIKLVLDVDKIKYNEVFNFNHDEVCSCIGRDNYEVRPFFILECEKDYLDSDFVSKYKDVKPLKKKVNYFEMRQYESICKVNEYYSKSMPIVKLHNVFNNYIEKEKVVDALKNRTSAHNLVGNINFNDLSRVNDLNEMFIKFLDYKKALTKSSYFKCYYIENGNDISMDICGEDLSVKNINGDIDKKHFNIIHDSYDFFQTHTFKGLFVIAADIDRLKQDKDLNYSYLDYLLLTTGDLMQCMSLICSDKGYFCRPIKNYKDEYLGELLSEESPIMYIAAIGEENNCDTLKFNAVR